MKRKTIQHEGRDLEVIIPDEGWMEDKYAEFKAAYFDGEGFMPDGTLGFKINNRLSRSWGMAKYWKSKRGDSGMFTSKYSRRPVPPQYVGKDVPSPMWLWNGQYSQDLHPKVRIDLRATKWLPEQVFENTMIHEMCHIFCYLNGLWTGVGGHDGWFKVLSDKIKEKSNGKYEIMARVSTEDSALCDQINSTKPGYVVMLYLNGTVPYAFRDSIIGYSYGNAKRKRGETDSLFYWANDEMEAKSLVASAFKGIGSIFAGKPFGIWSREGRPTLPRIEKAYLFISDSANIEDPRKKKWPDWIKKRSMMAADVPVSLTNKRLEGSYDLVSVLDALIKSKALVPTNWVKNTLGESLDRSEERNMELVYEGMMDAIRNAWNRIMDDIKEVMASLRIEFVHETEDGWEVV